MMSGSVLIRENNALGAAAAPVGGVAGAAGANIANNPSAGNAAPKR
jgi:hypothetical protein